MNDQSIVPVDNNSVVPTGIQSTSLTSADKTALQEQSDQLVTEILGNLDDQRMIERIANLGVQTQSQVAGKLSILRKRVGDIVGVFEDPEAGMPKNILELQVQIDRLNVNKLCNPTVFESIFGFLPWVNPIRRAIKTVRSRQGTVKESVDSIMEVVLTNKDEVLRDNMEMLDLIDDCKATLLPLNKVATLGEFMFAGLQAAMQAESDPTRKSKLLELTNDVGIRVQDLRTIENANVQFLMFCGQQIGSNRRYAQAADRTVTIARDIIEIALYIRYAQQRTKAAIKSVKKTQAYAAMLMEQTAQGAQDAARDSIALYQNPVIALESMTKSFDTIMETFDIMDKARTEGIVNASKGIGVLNDMTSRLKQRAGLDPAAKSPAIESIEVAAT